MIWVAVLAEIFPPNSAPFLCDLRGQKLLTAEYTEKTRRGR
jgi:hypothetical protein